MEMPVPGEVCNDTAELRRRLQIFGERNYVHWDAARRQLLSAIEIDASLPLSSHHLRVAVFPSGEVPRAKLCPHLRITQRVGRVGETGVVGRCERNTELTAIAPKLYFGRHPLKKKPH